MRSVERRSAPPHGPLAGMTRWEFADIKWNDLIDPSLPPLATTVNDPPRVN